MTAKPRINGTGEQMLRARYPERPTWMLRAVECRRVDKASHSIFYLPSIRKTYNPHQAEHNNQMHHQAETLRMNQGRQKATFDSFRFLRKEVGMDRIISLPPHPPALLFGMWCHRDAPER